MTVQIADVLIIGSGHAGGMAAKILTESGIHCLLLNAGPVVDVRRQAQRKAPCELPFRGFKPPGKLEHVFHANEFNTSCLNYDSIVDTSQTVARLRPGEAGHVCAEPRNPGSPKGVPKKHSENARRIG